MIRGRGLTAATVCALLVLGCAAKQIASYMPLIETDWQPPSAAEIVATSADSRSIEGSRREIWQSCMAAARQGLGVVHADRDRGVLVYFPAVKLPVTASKAWATDSRSAPLPSLALAVAVVDSRDAQIVHFAWISPESGRTAPIGAPGQIRTKSEQALFLALRAASVACLDEIERATHGTGSLAHRLRLDETDPPRGIRLDWTDDEVSAKQLGIAIAFSAWQSAETIRTNIVVDDDALTGAVHAVLARLQAAAGRAGDGSRVIILGSREWQAFTVGNGDIFVSSAALKSLGGPTELAGLLAHEYSHLLHQDPVWRIFHADRRRKQQWVTMISLYGIGIVAGATIGLESADKNPSDLFSSGGEGLPGPVAGGLLGGMLVGMSAGIWAGTDIGNAVYHTYAQDLEFLADRNASELLWLAGFPADAWLNTLRKKLASSQSSFAPVD